MHAMFSVYCVVRERVVKVFNLFMPHQTANIHNSDFIMNHIEVPDCAGTFCH